MGSGTQVDSSIRSLPLAVLTLRNERIPGRITKNPEEDHQDEPRPKIKRRNEESSLRLTSNRALRVTEKTVNNKRQGQHEERIKLECRDGMEMQQLIARAR